MFGTTGPQRVFREATVAQSPDGIFKVVGAFVQGFQNGLALSPETQHTSTDDYSTTSIAELATVKVADCVCVLWMKEYLSTHLLFRVAGEAGVSSHLATGSRQTWVAGEIVQST